MRAGRIDSSARDMTDMVGEDVDRLTVCLVLLILNMSNYITLAYEVMFSFFRAMHMHKPYYRHQNSDSLWPSVRCLQTMASHYLAYLSCHQKGS